MTRGVRDMGEARVTGDARVTRVMRGAGGTQGADVARATSVPRFTRVTGVTRAAVTCGVLAVLAVTACAEGSAPVATASTTAGSAAAAGAGSAAGTSGEPSAASATSAAITTAGTPAAATPTSDAALASQDATGDPATLQLAATSGIPVPAALFGMHPTNGVPTVPTGSARLWDSGTRWAELEPVKGRLNLRPLEERVTTLRKAGITDIVYVLGSTPRWAAASLGSVDLYGPGTSSPPRNVADFERYVTAVVKRFKGRITAYQVWNEANLTSFWRGSPAQMADLTWRVKRIVRANDPRALVVAASTTTRLTSAYRRFLPAYLSGLRARGWPVDVFAGHFYPQSTGTPTTRLQLIGMMRRDLRAAGAPSKPLWDTEVNFGLKGPGPTYPDRDIEGATAAAWVARTYLDSVRGGVARAYWYAWTPPRDLLGITLYSGSRGAAAFSRAHAWLAGGTFRGCTTRGTYTSCRVVKKGVPAAVVWTESGQVRVTVPASVRWACPASGVCTRVTPGSRYLVGPVPVRLAATP